MEIEKVKVKLLDILKAIGMQNDADILKELHDTKERLLSGLFGLVGSLSCEFSWRIYTPTSSHPLAFIIF
jgi:hypothetical protein